MTNKSSLVIRAKFNKKIQELIQELFELSCDSQIPTNSASLEQIETDLDKLTRELKDLIAGKKLQEAIDVKADEIRKLAKILKLKNFGCRPVYVRMSGGMEVELL